VPGSRAGRDALARRRPPRLAELLTKYQDGDTIFWYDSPEAEWATNMGSAGYYLVRDGFLVDDVLMRMN
jgi:hypothetical protein